MSRWTSPPSRELAEKLLGTVPFRDRFPAGRLKPPVGLIPSPVRGLREAHLLLEPDVRSLPGLNLAALAAWIRRVIGDGELAQALENETQTANSYVDGCLRAYAVIGDRLTQARQVLDGTADPDGVIPEEVQS